MLSWFPLAVACGVAIVAGAIDARTGRIPNGLTLPALIAAPVLRALLEGTSGLFGAALGVALVGLVPLALFVGTRGRGIGGGDVKLFAGLGAWLGPGLGLEMQLAAWSLALLGACTALAWRGRLIATWVGALRRVVTLRRGQRGRVPLEALTPLRMGPAIAVGTLLVVLGRLGSRLPWLP